MASTQTRRATPPRPRPSTGGPARDEALASFGLVLVLGSCLAFAPGALFRFTLAKLLVLAVGIALAACATAAGRLPRAVVATVLLGAGVLVAAALLGEAPAAQLLGRWPRYEGLVALPLYVGAVWTGARLLGPGAPSGRLLLARRTLAGVALVLAAVSLAEAAGLRPLGGDVARPGAVLGNATDQGVVGMLLLAALLAAAVASPSSLVRLGAAAAGAVVVVSGSRAAWGAAVVAALVVAGLTATRAPGGRLPRLRRTPLVAVLGLVAGALLLPGTRDRLTGSSPLALESATGRVDLWTAAVRLLEGRPLGVGPSGYVDALPSVLGAEWWATADASAVVDSPHSWILQALVAGGVGLLSLGVVLALLVLRSARRAVRTAQTGPAGRSPLVVGAAAALAGYAVALAVQPTSVGTVGVAAVLAGALLAEPVRPRETSGPRPGGTPGRPAHPVRQRALLVGAGAGLAAAVLLPAVAAEYALDSAYAAAAAGDAEAAGTAFSRAATLRPWDADLPLLAATALGACALAGDEGCGPEALVWGERAVRRLPASTEAAKALLVAQLATGDVAGAAATAARAGQLAPGDPEVQLYQGFAAAVAGDLSAAETALRAATGNPHTAARAWDLLAGVYEQQGRDGDASAARAAARSAQDGGPGQG